MLELVALTPVVVGLVALEIEKLLVVLALAVLDELVELAEVGAG